ncbi:ArsC family reductase [Craterilacuibacter sp.]|uniref:ArsC family reductase n=1 Tax=Craterilacuibacter sp. TaxID=2870909 RepID=UPI003F30DB80
MITIYGIPNCSTVKKARLWLNEQQLDSTFHDFKKQGIDTVTLSRWLRHTSLATLINRKGTTWRALSDEDKLRADSPDSAIALMMEKPSLIKRPVLEQGSQLLVGFSEDSYQALKP